MNFHGVTVKSMCMSQAAPSSTTKMHSIKSRKEILMGNTSTDQIGKKKGMLHHLVRAAIKAPLAKPVMQRVKIIQFVEKPSGAIGFNVRWGWRRREK